MKKSIKLVMALFAVMLVSITSVFAYSVDDLTDAAYDGDINKVKACVSGGVDVNARDSDGWTALSQAAYYGHTTIMKYLISKGASVDRPIKDTKNGNSATPLYYAARQGKFEAVKILIYNDADPNIKHTNGKSPLQIAQEEGYSNIVKFLKEQGSKSSSSSNSSSSAKADVNAFVAAAKAGDLETVKKQISLGVDINALDKDKWTALTQAAYHGRTDVLKYLISKGCQINKEIPDSKGKNAGGALYYAARQGKLDCVKALVEAKADLNGKRPDGTTPLAIATKNGHTEVVNYLKSKGAK